MNTIQLDEVLAVDETQLNSMSVIIEKLNAADLFASLTDDAQRAGVQMQRVENVAVIPLKGFISKNQTLFSLIFGGTSLQGLKEAVTVAVKDEDVDTILFNADTPGGSTDGMADFGDFLKAAGQEKRIVTQVNGLLASGGMWIGSFSHEIIAGRMDRIGSIGVRAAIIDSSKQAEKNGIKVITIDTGDFKSAGMPGTPVTKAHIADMQKTVDTMFAEFKEAVITGRNLSEKQFKAVSDGRMFFAPEALELGLIDAIGSMDDTLTRLTDKRPQMSVAEARQKLR